MEIIHTAYFGLCCPLYAKTVNHFATFSGRYRDAAQLKRKTMMDDKKDPLGLQEGPFSFSMVRFNSLAVLVTYYRAFNPQLRCINNSCPIRYSCSNINVQRALHLIALNLKQVNSKP